MKPETEFQDWIGKLAQGDPIVAETIWENYFSKLVGLARRKLDGMPRRAADEEDVALSALKSFVRGVEKNRFPRLDDPDDLWKILVTITARKAHALRRRHMAAVRGGGQIRGESVFIGCDFVKTGGIGEVLGDAPSPEFQAMMTDECGQMLGELDDPQLRVVALCKLEGNTNDEIADVFNTTSRTVERWLRRIREQWEHRQ